MANTATYSSARVLSRFVLERAPEPLVVLDTHGAVVDANRSAREERRFDLLGLFSDTSLERPLRGFLAALRAGGHGLLELQRVGGAGRAGQLRLEGFAVEDWFVVSVRDVSERSDMELELRQLRRADSLGLLTASIIHDFNNLLTPILGWTTILANELDASSPAASLAADIESMAARAATRVRVVRSLTQPKRSGREAVGLNAIIRVMRPLLERLFGGRMELEFKLDERVGCVRIDRGQLEHALLNLLVNARNALPGAGRVTISTSLVEGAATPELSPAAFVALAVSDTGTGMSEEVRARAFEEFFTTRATSGGTGLGLASVKRFASESGGRVTLESALGRGTTVTLLLPPVV
jgi:two-component system cell cycle sensor histidine kinase/response regulator CckA